MHGISGGQGQYKFTKYFFCLTCAVHHCLSSHKSESDQKNGKYTILEMWQEIVEDDDLFRKLKENLRSTGITTNVGVSEALNTSVALSQFQPHVEVELRRTNEAPQTKPSNAASLFFNAVKSQLQKICQACRISIHEHQSFEHSCVHQTKHKKRLSTKDTEPIRRRSSSSTNYSQVSCLSQPNIATLNIRRMSWNTQDCMFFGPEENLHDIKYKTLQDLGLQKHTFKETLAYHASSFFAKKRASSMESKIQKADNCFMEAENRQPRQVELKPTRDDEATSRVGCWTDATIIDLYEETLTNNWRRNSAHRKDATLQELEDIENETVTSRTVASNASCIPDRQNVTRTATEKTDTSIAMIWIQLHRSTLISRISRPECNQDCTRWGTFALNVSNQQSRVDTNLKHALLLRCVPCQKQRKYHLDKVKANYVWKERKFN